MCALFSPCSCLKVGYKGWVSIGLQLLPGWVRSCPMQGQHSGSAVSQLQRQVRNSFAGALLPGLRLPLVCFLGMSSSPPTHYLVYELYAKILAHWRTRFSGVCKKRKAICGGCKPHLVLHVEASWTPEGGRQSFSANFIFILGECIFFFNFQFVSAANKCFFKKKNIVEKYLTFKEISSIASSQIIWLDLFCLGNHVHMYGVFV